MNVKPSREEQIWNKNNFRKSFKQVLKLKTHSSCTLKNTRKARFDLGIHMIQSGGRVEIDQEQRHESQLMSSEGERLATHCKEKNK